MSEDGGRGRISVRDKDPYFFLLFLLHAVSSDYSHGLNIYGNAGGRIRTHVGHSPICSRGRRFSPLSHPSQKFNLSTFY